MRDFDLQTLRHLDPDVRERLALAGLRTIFDVFRHCLAPEGRRRIAGEWLTEEMLESLARSVELVRIMGVDPVNLDLLNDAGVCSLADLCVAEPTPLADALLAANERRERTRLVPSVTVVMGWIEQAQRLQSLVVKDDAADPLPS